MGYIGSLKHGMGWKHDEKCKREEEEGDDGERERGRGVGQAIRLPVFLFADPFNEFSVGNAHLL